MNLRSLTDKKLRESTKRSVEKEREAMTKVLHHFCEIDDRRAYGRHSSLYQYATRELHYTEAEANSRVTASRLVRELPALEAKIESGALSLTQLVKASAFFHREKKAKKPLTSAEKQTVLTEIEHNSVEQSERLFFTLSANPHALKERTRVASATHIEIITYASDEEMMMFKRVKETWAHRLLAPTWMELFVAMAEEVLDRHDPLKNAERSMARKAKRETANLRSASRSSEVNPESKAEERSEEKFAKMPQLESSRNVARAGATASSRHSTQQSTKARPKVPAHVAQAVPHREVRSSSV